MTENELIAACKKNDRKAQKVLYNRYSPPMFGLARRYVSNREDAEDVLVEAFFKVLTNIDQYSGKGSFQGWIRRIVINEALMFLRRQHNFNMTVELEHVDVESDDRVVDELAAQDIIDLLEHLPTGYRTVFNLFVLEEYKHRE
ncbi:MAG: RNA polymerase sigma factor, partial [Saprospiraceae bacterium]|nr:RNA polymerase sigma factor [Saprospiraceae bacterium]